MSKIKASAIAAGVGLSSMIAVKAASAEEFPNLDLSLSLGWQHDSHLSVDAIDQSSSVDDSALRTEASGRVNWFENEGRKLQTEYSYLQTTHTDYSEFDMTLHRVGATYGHEIDDTQVTASYFYNAALLDGDDLLDIHSAKIGLGRLMWKKIYATTGYEYQKHEFQQIGLEQRDADRHQFDFGALYVLGKKKTVSLNAVVADHDAVSSELDYESAQVTGSLKWPVKVFGVEGSRLGLRYRYRVRDYLYDTASIGEERYDERHTYRARLDVPFVENVTGRIQFEHTASESNLPSADYDNDHVRLMLIWKN